MRIRNSLLIGADDYETLDEMVATEKRGVPPIGIGSESIIENAIIDKNARIGRGVRIVNEAGVKEKDGDGYFIREGDRHRPQERRRPRRHRSSPLPSGSSLSLASFVGGGGGVFLAL